MISVGNPGEKKKTGKSLEFCFKKSVGALERRLDIRHLQLTIKKSLIRYDVYVPMSCLSSCGYNVLPLKE